MKNDISVLAIFNWIVEKIVYIACVLFLFFGAAFAEVYRKEEDNPLPFWQKAFSVVFSVALMAMVFGSLISRFELDPYLMCGMAAFMGMGSHYLALWLLSYWQNSKGLDSFIGKISRLINVGRKIMNEDEEGPGVATKKDEHTPD